MSVFTRLQKRTDERWGPTELADKLRKWNESCWKAVVYVTFSGAAYGAAAGEPWLLDPLHFWTGATQFPLNYHVPRKVVAFYLLEIGFYIQVGACARGEEGGGVLSAPGWVCV
jgi:hypothetical protein